MNSILSQESVRARTLQTSFLCECVYLSTFWQEHTVHFVDNYILEGKLFCPVVCKQFLVAQIRQIQNVKVVVVNVHQT